MYNTSRNLYIGNTLSKFFLQVFPRCGVSQRYRSMIGATPSVVGLNPIARPDALFASQVAWCRVENGLQMQQFRMSEEGLCEIEIMMKLLAPKTQNSKGFLCNNLGHDAIVCFLLPLTWPAIIAFYRELLGWMLRNGNFMTVAGKGCYHPFDLINI